MNIVDDYGFHWEWDWWEKRVYCVEAEEGAVFQNGYHARTRAEAIEVLYDGGYIGTKGDK